MGVGGSSSATWFERAGNDFDRLSGGSTIMIKLDLSVVWLVTNSYNARGGFANYCSIVE